MNQLFWVAAVGYIILGRGHKGSHGENIPAESMENAVATFRRKWGCDNPLKVKDADGNWFDIPATDDNWLLS